MISLIHAGSALKKVAYSKGIRTNQNSAWFKPITDNERGAKAVIGDDTGKEVEVTVFDLESASRYTWEEVRAGHI